MRTGNKCRPIVYVSNYEEMTMQDFWFIALTVVFFTLATLYVKGLCKL